MNKLFTVSGVILFLQQQQSQNKVSMSEVTEKLSMVRNAVCYLFPKENNGAQGMVSFSQANYGAVTKMAVVVRGLRPNGLHGIHIHENGDYQNPGPIYNPFNRRHGGPLDKERKVGDLGNIKTDERGNGFLAVEDFHVQLYGDNSILGRSVAIKADEDDLGRGGKEDSYINGHSGKIVSYGVIGLTDIFKNLPPFE